MEDYAKVMDMKAIFLLSIKYKRVYIMIPKFIEVCDHPRCYIPQRVFTINKV